jgi:hypothetical protein
MSIIPGFTDLRALHAEREKQAAQQRETAIRGAAETINLLTTIVQAPGYKVWKDALLASAQAEHQNAMNAKDAHSMAIALGAESAYRAAAHAAEDILASNQTTIGALKR